mgnify:CR=1 FL=1
MAKEVLKINGHDWSGIIQSKGYGWTRNDLDTDQTKRPKNGVLRREKIGTKRKISFTTMPAPREKLAQLDDDLSEEFFDATYLDLHGVMTRTFYCTSFETSVVEVGEDYESWSSATFSMIER